MHSQFQHFTHRTITDKVIVATTAHDNRMLAEELPDDPPLLAEDALQRHRSRPSISRHHAWVYWHHGRIAARAGLAWMEVATNRQVANVYVSVESALRRSGLGSQLLSLAIGEAVRARRSTLISATSDLVPAGQHFVERAGFRMGLETHINQLVLARLDRALMGGWIATSAERAGDYAVEIWDGPVPEGDLVAYAGLVGVMNSAPRGSLDIEDFKVTPKMVRDGEAWLFSNGSRRLVAFARHRPTGALAGFTQLTWNPKRASIVWQGDTGVVPEHRNRGLGRWLKATNVEAMLAANPAARFVRTGNADSNAPMLAINQRMGFEPFIAHATWQAQA